MQTSKIYKILALLFLLGIAICLIIIMINNGSLNFNKEKKEIDKINSEFAISREDETVSENVTNSKDNIKINEFERDIRIVDDENKNVEMKISDDTVVTYVTEYTLCGHVNESIEKAEAEMVNLTKDEFIEKYPLYEIEHFSDDEIILKYTIEDYCPNHYIVREHNGNIGVYYRSNQIDNPLIKVINIDIKTLREKDQIKINEGIEVNSDKELAQLIEDFSS